VNPAAQSLAEAAVDSRSPAACPACEAPAAGAAAEVPDHEYGLAYCARYAHCGNCGTLFQEPMPSLQELARFYPPDYHSMTHAGLLSAIRNHVRIARLEKLAPREGAILDYGCGDGAFLVQAARRMSGRPLWGFEIAERAEKTVLAGGAVTVVKGSLRDLLAVVPECGLITLNHVIEHLPDPGATVSALVERLAPGGVFEGQTPAADSLERAVFGVRWSGYHAPRHTVVFSRAGLCRLLERCGLTGAVTQAAFNPAGLAVSLASLPHHQGGRIRRSGLTWLLFLALAGMLGPVDLLSGRPGVVNFCARKRGR
jgi:SAM-dependent methyltransferase